MPSMMVCFQNYDSYLSETRQGNSNYKQQKTQSLNSCKTCLNIKLLLNELKIKEKKEENVL